MTNTKCLSTEVEYETPKQQLLNDSTKTIITGHLCVWYTDIKGIGGAVYIIYCSGHA